MLFYVSPRMAAWTDQNLSRFALPPNWETFALPHRRGPAALGGRGQGRRGAHELDELERRAAGASMHAYGGADVVVHAELC